MSWRSIGINNNMGFRESGVDYWNDPVRDEKVEEGYIRAKIRITDKKHFLDSEIKNLVSSLVFLLLGIIDFSIFAFKGFSILHPFVDLVLVVAAIFLSISTILGYKNR